MAQLQEAVDRWQDLVSQRSVLALRDTATSLLFPGAAPHIIHLLLELLLQKELFADGSVPALLS